MQAEPIVIDRTPSPAARHALVVEADPACAEHAAGAVGRLHPPWRVSRCDTAASALRAAHEPGARLRLALVALDLPDVSGVEVVRELRWRFPDCAILAISTTPSGRTLLAAIRAGANGCVLKGDGSMPLAVAIGQVLAGHGPISAELAGHLFRIAAAAPLEGGAAESIPPLTQREHQALRHIANGCTYAQAAQRMGIAQTTVENHIANLYRKLDAHSQVQAVGVAWRAGLL